MSYQVGKTAGTVLGGRAPMATREVNAAPALAPISCIDSFIGRAQEHNDMLRRLIERTKTVADRMLGGQPEEKDGSGQSGPINLLGVLETALMTSEILATKLLEQISRLEVL